MDRRFLREGFPPSELAVTTATNPARTLGADLDLPNYRAVKDGTVIPVGDYTLEVVATPRPHPGAALPVAGVGGHPFHRRPRSL